MKYMAIMPQGPVRMAVHSHSLDKTEARSIKFTEQESFWTLPLHETSAIADVAVTQGTVITYQSYVAMEESKRISRILSH